MKRWLHKFILNLTDLYKSQTNLIFWHSLLNLKITFKSQNLYHFKTPPPLLSVPLVARERKVSFSPHKSHLESFFFSESVFPSNSIMGLLWCYKIDFPGLVIKKVVKSMCRFLSKAPTTHTIYTRNNMGQKCEGNCGLWVLNEILKKHILKVWKKNHGCRLGVNC